MKTSIIIEQKVAIVALVILLALCIKSKSESEAYLSDYAKIYTVNVKDSINGQAAELNESILNHNASQYFSISDDLKYEDVQKWVDTRNGDFKSARYVPQHRSVRYFESGKMAVVNSLVEIRYENIQVETVSTFRKIDVFVNEKGVWAKPRARHINSQASLAYTNNK